MKLGVWGFVFCFILSGCKEGGKEQKKSKEAVKFEFEKVKNIRYYEVKRVFSNGLSVYKNGFHLEPNWVIEFLSNDSIAAWSPDMHRWHHFPVLYDHDSIYNFVREYFRVKKVTKDSLQMQRLEVKNLEVDAGQSDVNITFYSRDYIFNKLKTNPEVLQRPTRKDTLFVWDLVKKSNRNQFNPDSAFSARNPVEFIPTSKAVTVVKEKTYNELGKENHSYDYLYPKYSIQINKAYKNFAHTCLAIVDAAGNVKVIKPLNVLPEAEENKKMVIQEIVNVYIKHLFKTIPGSTFKMPHSSVIELYIVGKN